MIFRGLFRQELFKAERKGTDIPDAAVERLQSSGWAEKMATVTEFASLAVAGYLTYKGRHELAEAWNAAGPNILEKLIAMRDLLMGPAAFSALAAANELGRSGLKGARLAELKEKMSQAFGNRDRGSADRSAAAA